MSSEEGRIYQELLKSETRAAERHTQVIQTVTGIDVRQTALIDSLGVINGTLDDHSTSIATMETRWSFLKWASATVGSLVALGGGIYGLVKGLWSS